MAHKPIKVAVVGLGHNGLAFCKDYAENPAFTLHAVCDINAGRAAHAAALYGARRYTGDEVFQDAEIDAFSIHTPDSLHAGPFLRALEAGCHVFVEKPMADSREDLEKMVAAHRAHPGQVCLVGHVLRYDPYFAAVKKWCDQGTLGDIVYMEADYIHDLRYQAEMEPWKLEQEMPMLGGGCHPLDILRWLNGCDITEVFSMSSSRAYPAMWHNASIVSTFRFENGATAKVTALYGCPAPMPPCYNLAVYGTKGCVVRDRLALDGLAGQPMTIPLTNQRGHPYMPETVHFADCINTGKKPLITPQDAANTVLACLLATQAADTGASVPVPRL